MTPATDPETPAAAAPHVPVPATGADDLPPLLRDPPAAGEFTRLALWMAGAVAGLRTEAHAAQAADVRRFARRVGWPVRRRRRARPGPADAVGLLADALTGTSRSAIAAVFGPPRCGLRDRAVVTGDAVWGGAVWYYPLRANPTADAVAIAFDPDGQACRVVFVGVRAAA